MKNEQVWNDMIIDHAVKNKLITSKQHTEYLGASTSRKNGIVARFTRRLALDMQSKAQERLAERAT